MLITILKSKIYQATVNSKNLNYQGSIEIDEELMNKADLREFEKVLVVNINNGQRFETYVIKGKKKSKIISLQGGTARLGEIGDRLIIFSFAHLTNEELEHFKPTVIKLNDKNKIINAK
ncbi:MAG: aspartate 1-decarboxylase [bacterium]|nr:aspartate 1-decarboxylase [bacterium]